MSARRIDGKAAAAALRERVAGAVARFRSQRRPRAGPCGRAGRRRSAERGLCPLEEPRRRAEAGMESFEHKLPADDQRGRAAGAGRSSSTPIRAVDGILVQLPLPPQIDERAVIDAHSIRTRTSTAFIR